MSVKFYCDFCKKETENKDIVGEFNWVEFQTDAQLKQIPAQKKEQYCSECVEKVKKAIAGLKEADKKTSENKSEMKG